MRSRAARCAGVDLQNVAQRGQGFAHLVLRGIDLGDLQVGALRGLRLAQLVLALGDAVEHKRVAGAAGQESLVGREGGGPLLQAEEGLREIGARVRVVGELVDRALVFAQRLVPGVLNA